MSQSPTFCVIGAGAMGGLYGGRLARAGYDVTLVDTWREHVDAINGAGLVLEDAEGSHCIDVAAVADPAGIQGVDVAIVFVDANSTGAAGAVAARVLAPEGVALTLQNGIGNIEALTGALGDERVMAGLSYSSAAVAGPGHVLHTHAGPTWLGERGGGRSERLTTLCDAFERAGLDPVQVDDVVAHIWNKWVLNCAINALCAATGLRQGEIPRTDAVDAFQDRILDETLAVVAARGITLSDPDVRATIKAQCWKKFNKPSMLQHVEAGKRTEIDALNGAVVRLGRECGVATPYNDALTSLIKGLEKARRQALHGPAIDYQALEREAAAQAS